MTQRALPVIPMLKAATAAAAVAPLLWLTWGVASHPAAGRPLKHAFHQTGTVTLVLLLATLAVTPARRLTGWNRLGHVRRVLGLFACFYAVVHLTLYVTVHRGGDVARIWRDLHTHLYVDLGLLALLLMLPLAATSTGSAVRRLGARRWTRLHQLTYVVLALGVTHFTLSLDHGVGEAVPYLVAAAVLLAYRPIAWAGSRRRPKLVVTPTAATPPAA